MPEVKTVSVSPTCGTPAMVGCPVAGEFERAATAAVAALVTASALPASSVKLTVTLIALPCSAEVSV